jgi:chemotaxis regulatin CheY-phosphate phosphatase CheZ
LDFAKAKANKISLNYDVITKIGSNTREGIRFSFKIFGLKRIIAKIALAIAAIN